MLLKLDNSLPQATIKMKFSIFVIVLIGAVLAATDDANPDSSQPAERGEQQSVIICTFYYEIPGDEKNFNPEREKRRPARIAGVGAHFKNPLDVVRGLKVKNVFFCTKVLLSFLRN